MGKRIRDYVKYTFSELERYVETSTSCINKVNTAFHLNFPPYGLINVRKTLRNIIAEKKVGLYDTELKGIILDMRNIKVLGDVAALRSDDPAIHLNLRADCYVFQPRVGAIVKGLVKHISETQIGVIIYRVFSVSIRLDGQVPRRVQLNSEIEFRIKQFELDGFMPFIEGELVADAKPGDEQKELKFNPNEFTPSRAKKSISFEPKIETGSSGYNSDGSHSKRVKKEIKSSSSSEDDDDDITPAQPNRPYRGSPDLFANLNLSDEEATPKAIKTEKLSQQTPVKIKEEEFPDLHNSSRKVRRSRKTSATCSEMSDLEPGQTTKPQLNQSLALDVTTLEVKEEVLSQSQRKKSKHKKHSISLAEEDGVEVKAKIKSEKLSQSQIAEHAHIDNQAEATPRHKKSKSKNKSGEEDEDEITCTPNVKLPKSQRSLLKVDSSATNHTESVDEINRHKRKRSESLDEIQPTPAQDQTLKKRKYSLATDSLTVDSDFEMTRVSSIKLEKKKKKSKDETLDRLDSANVSSQLDATTEIVDLDNYTPKKEKKKKKKSKDKDVDEL